MRRGARTGIRRMRSSDALIRSSRAGRPDLFRAKAQSLIGFRQIGPGRKLGRHLARPPVVTGSLTIQITALRSLSRRFDRRDVHPIASFGVTDCYLLADLEV